MSAQKNGQLPQTGEKRSSALAVGASLAFARTQLRLNL
ncbi:LPXTG cell wall anchor domain-containing protein [Lactobacillus kefiranofaciens]|nr:LPXTG cell wall anchor domain-containing protein [Lactobacillus kefiranofaciens]MDH5099860.1 LPXTG cell wall anchor domain-containing protein [Lactobacillus kefiranofaciens]